nr:C40 family peptidase [Gordonia araii]
MLLAPLRALLGSLGSGVLPDGGPSDQLRETSNVLADVRSSLAVQTRDLDTKWQGTTATATLEALQHSGTQHAHLADRGTRVATITDVASAVIRDGYRDLDKIVDSFISVADAGSPELLTPAGLPVLLRCAHEHLSQAVKVVERVRSDVDGETKKLQAIADEQAKDDRSIRSRSAALDRLDAVSGAANPAADTAAMNEVAGGVQVTLPNGKVVTAPNEKAAAAVRTALTQRGVPYVWGGTTPGKGLDCSGLTQYSYRQAGVEIPRLAQEQTTGTRIPESQAMAGDLVVWDGHVAMALGDGTLIEAGDPVSISAMRTDNIGMGYKGVYRPTA